MQTLNRFVIFTKRIFTKKIYVLMLAALILMTLVYVSLPTKNQTADIKVALYCQDTSGYYEHVLSTLYEKNSLYTFYEADSEKDLIYEVKSQKAECGFYIPEGFFDAYILGQKDTQMIQYVIPSSALATAISETLYSNIFQVCSPKILESAVNTPEYNQELTEGMDYYMNSDEIFTVSDVSNGKLDTKTYQYKINLPVFELSIILILASGLMGLLVYYEDLEKGIYTPLGNRAKFGIKTISVITAILPILIVGTISSMIATGKTSLILLFVAYALAIFLITILISLVIKKSRHLTTLIPIILLLTVICSFASSII